MNDIGGKRRRESFEGEWIGNITIKKEFWEKELIIHMTTFSSSRDSGSIKNEGVSRVSRASGASLLVIVLLLVLFLVFILHPPIIILLEAERLEERLLRIRHSLLSPLLPDAWRANSNRLRRWMRDVDSCLDRLRPRQHDIIDAIFNIRNYSRNCVVSECERMDVVVQEEALCVNTAEGALLCLNFRRNYKL